MNQSRKATTKREDYLIVVDSRTPHIIIVRPVAKGKILSRAKLTITIVDTRENKDGKIAIFGNNSCTTSIERSKMTLKGIIRSHNVKSSSNNSGTTLGEQLKGQTRAFGSILKQPSENRLK